MPACSVRGCNNRSEKGIRMFSFPKGPNNEERRKLWIKNINRNDLPPSRNVCEIHFAMDQFENNREDGKRLLKASAVPTLMKEKQLEDKIPGKKANPTRTSSRKRKIKTYEEYDSEDDEFSEDTTDFQQKPVELITKQCELKKCRACLSVFSKTQGHILKKMLDGQILKDRLLIFIPQLKLTLSDSEYICDKCCRLLLKFNRFIESCIVTDNKLKTGMVSLEVEVESKGTPTPSDEVKEEQEEDQKVGRKRKQDLVNCQEENDKSEKKTPARKRGRPRKSVSKDFFNQSDLDGKKENFDKEDEKDQEINELQKRLRPRKPFESKQVESVHEGSFEKDIPTEKNVEIIVSRKRGRPKKNSISEEFIVEIKDDQDSLDKSNEKLERSKSETILIDNTVWQVISDHDYLTETNDIKTEELFECPDCKFSYRTPKGLLQHLKDIHDIQEISEFKCTTCNMKFVHFKDKIKHINDFHKSCEFCEKIFLNPENLTSHKIVHMNKYLCTKCGIKFQNENLLAKHLNMHEIMAELLLDIRRAKNKILKCNECDSTFTMTTRLKMHVKSVHLRIKDIECPECDKKFTTRPLMKNHMRVMHSNEAPYECDICYHSFKRKDYLTNHKLTHKYFTDPNRRTYSRVQNTEFECPFCLKKETTKELLLDHFSVHAQERKFECVYCSLKFSSYRTKYVHERTHENDSHFICLTCFKTFRTTEALSKHEIKHRLHHMKFVCCICRAQFSKKILLENHVLDLHINTDKIPTSIKTETTNEHIQLFETDLESEVETDEDTEFAIELKKENKNENEDTMEQQNLKYEENNEDSYETVVGKSEEKKETSDVKEENYNEMESIEEEIKIIILDIKYGDTET